AFSGSHGKCAGHGEEFESRKSGYRRKPAAGAGFGAGSQRNVHFYPQDSQGEEGQVSGSQGRGVPARPKRVTKAIRKRNYAGRGCSQFGWQESRPGGTRGRGFWRESEPAPAARSFALVFA